MNTKRKILLTQLATYFIKKGGVMTEREYKKQHDVPIRLFFIKRHIGSWARTMLLLKNMFPEVYEVTKPEPAAKPVVKSAVKPVVKPAVKEVKDEK